MPITGVDCIFIVSIHEHVELDLQAGAKRLRHSQHFSYGVFPANITLLKANEQCNSLQAPPPPPHSLLPFNVDTFSIITISSFHTNVFKY